MTAVLPTTLRTLGIVAHVDAGKTTLSERLLYVTGRLHRTGEVHHGSAALDHLAEERARGITITAAATTCTWRGCLLQLVDTPGHVDFTVEVGRSLRVLDAAVVVLDAVAGVEPQTEAVWHQAEQHRLPRLAFVNKLDRPGADVDGALAGLRRLGAEPVALQLPLPGEQGLQLVDLVAMRLLSWPDADDARRVEVTDLPEELLVRARQARAVLVEAVAAADDVALADWLESGPDLSADVLGAGLRRATLAGRVVPVLYGAALRNVGVQPLLDAVVAYLPGPLDRPPAVGRVPGEVGRSVVRPARPDAALAATAFKVVHVGGTRLVWLRLWSGTLRPGDRVLLPRTGSVERVGRLLRLHGGQVEAAPAAEAGSVVAAAGLATACTGDTVCGPDDPVVLPGLDVPDPVMGLAVEPTGRSDADRLSRALAQLVDEDPSCRVHSDRQTGQLVLSGQGELHLQVLLGRLRDAGASVVAGAPRVALRETVQRPAIGVTHRLVQQRGGPGVYAILTGNLEPTGRVATDALEVEDRTRGGALPARFADAAVAGARDALAAGPLGHPLVGLRLVLTDARTHSTDSSELAFRRAGRGLVLQAAEQAGTVLLEPVVRVEVSTPEEHIGAVSGLLSARRGLLTGVRSGRGARALVQAEVPLAELAEGFVAVLRSATSGRAAATTRLHGYRPVP